MNNQCGSCTACCRVFAIPELEKKIGDWCTHCDIGKGCKIYDDRPEVCIDFECLWLQSQRRETKNQLSLALRPDKSRVVISPTTNPMIISFITMEGHPLAWQKQPVTEVIGKLLRGGYKIAIGSAGSLTRTVLLMHPATGKVQQKEVRMTPPDKDGMQWNLR